MSRSVVAGRPRGCGAVVRWCSPAAVGWEMRAEVLPEVDEPAPQSAETVERGAYLARAGNCMACHTARGGEAYAGGRAIETPFGTVYAGNLTPEPATGLGRWSAEAFRRALHEGRSRDGRLLYPVFPYTHTTLVSDDDSDALYAFLRTVPPVVKPTPDHVLRWPVNTQAALAVWRLLYFESGRFQPETRQTAEWNRGAYLARGLAHCSACHSARDVLGGSSLGRALACRADARSPLAGAVVARSRRRPAWPTGRWLNIADLLQQRGQRAVPPPWGRWPRWCSMARSTWSATDLEAMAVFLKDVPIQAEPLSRWKAAEPSSWHWAKSSTSSSALPAMADQGQGAAGAYPALAGNRSVVMDAPVNAVQAVLAGGFAPATAGNPQPYGMPPFRTLLTDTEIAAVASFIRQSWGNRASPVAPQDVQRLR